MSVDQLLAGSFSEPAVFWSAFAGVATALSVIVALALPFWLRARDEDRARLLVARELHDNMPKVRAIAGLPMEGADQQPFQDSPMIQSLALISGLSTTHWNHFKFQLSAQHFVCFEPLFALLELLIATKNDPTLVMLARSKTAARSLVKEFKNVEPKCRFFRI